MGHDKCGFDHVIPGQLVNGARLFFVGEAGGFEEEVQLRPFVGKSGRRLDVMMKQFLGVDRSEVSVSNVFQHHPPKNRKPKKKEIDTCVPNLLEEIAATQPEIIVLVGGSALSAFHPKRKITKWHGLAWKEENGVLAGKIVVAWYHPAAGMRSVRTLKAIIADASRFWENVEAARKGVKYGRTYELVSASKAADLAEAGPTFAFDVETTNWRQGRLRRFGPVVGFSVASSDTAGCYAADNLRTMAPVLESVRSVKICHNVKFEYNRCQEAGITLQNFEDTRGLAYLLGLEDTSLKGLARRYLGQEPASFEEATGDVDQNDAAALGAKLAENYQYGAADAVNTFAVYPTLLKQVQEEGMERVYREIELPVIPVLSAMERQGICVDETRVLTEIAALDGVRDEARSAVYRTTGREFNLNSPAQKSAVLESLGYPLRVRTDSGYYVTDRRSLLAVREWGPEVIDALLRYTEYTKLQQFLRTFLSLRYEDGKLHPQYNQFGHEESASDLDAGEAPETGRLSSSYPNIQQIPHHRNPEWGSRIRRCLLPEPGWVWLRGDFAQEEPRVLALLSQDAQLLGDYASGRDVYAPAASSLYGYEVTKRTHPDERQNGKTFFLLWMYGGGAEKAAGIDPKRLNSDTARAGIRRLEQRYTGVVQYWRDRQKEAIELGSVSTVFGRKRYIPEVYSKDPSTRSHGLRVAVNSPIQGTCGDVMKLMLARVHARLDPSQARIIATVHDELDLQVRTGYADEAKSVMIEEAKRVLPGMELPMEFGIGDSWGAVDEH